jgi:hypothetical protein
MLRLSNGQASLRAFSIALIRGLPLLNSKPLADVVSDYRFSARDDPRRGFL